MLSRSDVDKTVEVMCAMRERGELSASGLVEGIKLTLDEYDGPPPGATERGTKHQVSVPAEDMPQAFLQLGGRKPGLYVDGRRV